MESAIKAILGQANWVTSPKQASEVLNVKGRCKWEESESDAGGS